VIDARIDVQAQYALMRMFRGGDSLEAVIASHVLSAVKDGSLGGIHQEDQQAPALRAQSMGYGWWQILPPSTEVPRTDGLCMVEPAHEAPIIVMRRNAQKDPAAYDAALVDAWLACDLPSTTARAYVTTLLDKEPPVKTTTCPTPAYLPTLTVKVANVGGDPLSGARVTVEDWGDTGNTDTSGFVTLYPPGAQLYRILVDPAPGADSHVYFPSSRRVRLLDDCHHSTTVYLVPRPNVPNE
jgi:hypothetical protein